MLDSNVYTIRQFWLGTISFCMPIYLLTYMHTDEATIYVITVSVAIVNGRHTEYIARSERYYGICRSYARDPAVHRWAGSVQDEIRIWKAFLHSCPFVRGIHQSLVDSPHKCTLWYLPNQVSEEMAKLPMIRNVMMLLWLHCNQRSEIIEKVDIISL